MDNIRQAALDKITKTIERDKDLSRMLPFLSQAQNFDLNHTQKVHRECVRRWNKMLEKLDNAVVLKWPGTKGYEARPEQGEDFAVYRANPDAFVVNNIDKDERHTYYYDPKDNYVRLIYETGHYIMLERF